MVRPNSCDEDVISGENPVVARVAPGANEHHVLGRKEAPVDRDVTHAALGVEGGAVARELREHRDRLREPRGAESEDAYAA